VRGLPIPIIILREQRTDLSSLEPRREVVDGQQRIRTLFSYVDPTLLPDFKPSQDAFTVRPIHNEEIAGKAFSDLSPQMQHNILDYEFSVHILPAGTDDREVLQIFSRLNATGIKLNYQELRNAEFVGEFKTSMYELASEQLFRWRKWGVFTEYNIARHPSRRQTGSRQNPEKDRPPSARRGIQGSQNAQVQPRRACTGR
jgi:hypothetical protein